MKKLFYLIFGIILLTSSCNDNKGNKIEENKGADTPARKNFTENDLTYQGQAVKLTKHGICRMDCRKLDAFEVQEVINQGNINKRKSDPTSKPCPTVAYEGRTSDGQMARVVVGTCENDIKIVTVIDLKTDWKCKCY
jgi:hypothetical protein